MLVSMRDSLTLLVVATSVFVGCAGGSTAGPPTAADAAAFLKDVDAKMLSLGIDLNQAGWVQQNFITVDTEALNAKANKVYIETVARFAKEASRFSGLDLPPDQRRQLDLLRLSLVMAAPNVEKEATELTTIAARMDGMYGRGKWCSDPAKPDTCLDIEAIDEIMANNRDPKRLREVWEGWHTISVPMRNDYQRFAELSNKGAKELGFADTGAMWRSKYHMPPDAFTKEMDRLWEQVRPLYNSLHAYMRMRLREKYGDLVPQNGPIPAHLLGNLWAQSWDNLYKDVAPKTGAPAYDLTAILKTRKTTPTDMVKYGERFFVSLGLAPLPQTFFERSLFEKPEDRDVVCHASAWAIDLADDVRIKMCIDPDGRRLHRHSP